MRLPLMLPLVLEQLWEAKEGQLLEGDLDKVLDADDNEWNDAKVDCEVASEEEVDMFLFLENARGLRNISNG